MVSKIFMEFGENVTKVKSSSKLIQKYSDALQG